MEGRDRQHNGTYLRERNGEILTYCNEDPTVYVRLAWGSSLNDSLLREKLAVTIVTGY